jgi:hypothetical protein
MTADESELNLDKIDAAVKDERDRIVVALRRLADRIESAPVARVSEGLARGSQPPSRRSCVPWSDAAPTRRNVGMEDDELSEVEALLLLALLSGERSAEELAAEIAACAEDAEHTERGH